jgi:hypothetical protein
MQKCNWILCVYLISCHLENDLFSSKCFSKEISLPFANRKSFYYSLSNIYAFNFFSQCIGQNFQNFVNENYQVLLLLSAFTWKMCLSLSLSFPIWLFSHWMFFIKLENPPYSYFTESKYYEWMFC